METEVNKVQEAMISEVLDGMIGSAPTPTTDTTESTIVEGSQANEQEGEKREEEKTSEQVSTGEVKSEEKTQEVVPVVTDETSVTPPVTSSTPVTPAAPQVPVVEETELDRLKRENAEFRLHLSDMAEKLTAPPVAPVRTPEQQNAEQANRQRSIYRFLKDDEAYDEVTKSAESFNVLLTSVVNTAIERSLKMIPQVASNMVEQQISLRTVVDDFFRANEDLLPQRKYVGFVTNEVTAAHPDWVLDKVLDETNKIARERLKLPRAMPVQIGVQSPASRTVDRNPGFVPSGGGGRRGSVQTETLTGQDRQIMDLLS
jgi:hypothetical protein